MSYGCSDFVNDVEAVLDDCQVPEIDRAAWCEQMAGEEPDETDEGQNLRLLAERACTAISEIDGLRDERDALRAALTRISEEWRDAATSAPGTTAHEMKLIARLALAGAK